MKPASLIRERLDEQVREQRIAHNEVEARRPTLVKLLTSARDAALTPSNARIAKKLEQRAEDIYARYVIFIIIIHPSLDIPWVIKCVTCILFF